MTRHLALLAGVAAACLSACATAQAPTAPSTSSATFVEACGPDIKQFCSAEKPGDGRITKCLRDNDDKLSQFCKQALTTARGQRERKNRN